jgi:glutamine---fructose-6-phosphate transaminase (isomerizing)
MCGIIAVLLGTNQKEDVFELLITSLKILQNRGYDSCGLMDSHFLSLLKAIKTSNDTIEELYRLKKDFPVDCDVGIAHTRWATSGGKTLKNAHPHLSMNGNFAVIHNGILENYQSIKKEMEKKQIKFSSETDTEVISNWLEQNSSENITEEEIVSLLKRAEEELEGTWALAVLHKSYPDSVFLAKNGSPLLVGVNKENGLMMAVSEISGFANKVHVYSVLKDSQVLHLKRGKLIEDLNFLPVPFEKIYISPKPFPHWMAKEIYDQINVIECPAHWGKYKHLLLKQFPELSPLFPLRESLLKKGSFDILLVGCGTSYHAGLAGRWFFKHFPFRTIRVIVASEFTEEDLPGKGKDGFVNTLAILVSQSGETKDVHRALKIIQKENIPTIGLVNVENSLIARECDITICLHAGREVAVASTKAYSTQLVGLKLIAEVFKNGGENKIDDDFLDLSGQIEKVLKDIFFYGGSDFSYQESFIRIANALDKKNHGFILSTGKLRAVSYEAALKIKEVGRIWIQGYPTGALKHGPFSLIEEETPVLFSLQSEEKEVLRRTESAIEEVHARGAKVFLFTDIEEYENKNVEEIISLPKNSSFSSIIHILPFQVLSYYLSRIRNLDADKPMHLAKVVTTD